jgi:hypothetical protein
MKLQYRHICCFYTSILLIDDSFTCPKTYPTGIWEAMVNTRFLILAKAADFPIDIYKPSLELSNLPKAAKNLSPQTMDKNPEKITNRIDRPICNAFTP